MRSTEPFNAGIAAAVLAFNDEAVVYCRSLSDALAQEYAMGYARMLRSRAKGLECEQVRLSANLFEPERNVIKGVLDRMYRKYFVTQYVTSKLP